MNHRRTFQRRARCQCVAFLLMLAFPLLHAADIDPAQLPAAATNHVDFNRDIRPIFENSCLRCHGPEKPKGGFRLNNRTAGLKGGNNGVDILPGNSAKSPLVRYVAYLVPDMEMPPLEKGKPLTARQIGLLRAWIDQGAAWDDLKPTNETFITLSPTFGGTIVSGNNHKYRELNWQKEGINGGVEQFELINQPQPDSKLSLSGRALQDDYKINLALDRNELGFIHSGWEQYRKYYDDVGGFRRSPSTPSTRSLGEDLHLDIGKAWVDFGLTLPNWPQMVFGYEYDYRKGNEAITSWGAAGTGVDARNLAPASQYLHEGVHVIKFDLDADVRTVTVEERFRAEFYKLDTASTNLAARNPIADKTAQSNHYFQGMNTLRLEKQFTTWLYGSAGYLYSKLDADANFSDAVTFNVTTRFFSQAPQITLEKETHVFNVNGLLGPFDGFTLSSGAQSEWSRQHGFGNGTLNQFTYSLTAPNTLAVTPTSFASEYDETSVSENVTLHYTKIPFTILFADGRLQQETIGQYDDDFQAGGNFLENPSFSTRRSDVRGGFETSPWQIVSLSAHYRRHEEDSDYKNNNPPQPPGGFPGFINARDVVTDEAEAKLVLHPCTWLKTTVSYQYLITQYWENNNPAFTTAPAATFSPGGNLLAGKYDSRVYSVNSSLTPVPRLYLAGTFMYQPTTVNTFANNSTSVAPYNGNIYSIIANGSFVCSEMTDLFANYAFSRADYTQGDYTAGLPQNMQYEEHSIRVGLDHRFGKSVSGKIQYGFDYYQEPSNGTAENFRAHTFLGTLTFRFR